MGRLLCCALLIGCGFDSETEGSPGIGEGEDESSGGGMATDSGAETMDPGSTGPGPIEGPAKQQLTLAALDGLDGAPLLVTLPEARQDLSFFGPDMATPLPHQFSTESQIWVRLPDPAPDHIWMTYDTGAPAAEDPPAVWQGFEAVWHFDEAPADATANGWDVQLGDAGYADGMVGGGLATSDEAHVQLDDGGPPLSDALTLEAWVRVEELDLGAARFVMRKQDAYYIRAVEQTNAQPRAGVRLMGDGLHEVGPAFTLATDWSYVALTYDGAEVRMFIDGAEVDADAVDAAAPVVDSDAPLELGRRLPGTLDEVRISSTARSPAWIEAQYASVTDAVITFEPPEPL